MRAPVRWVLSIVMMTIGTATYACERTSPECVVQETYQRYIRASLDLREPLKDPDIRQAIAPSLLKRLDRPTLRDEDYFLKVQDFPDSWAEQVKVERVCKGVKLAVVRVVLGQARVMHQTLDVVVAKSSGTWRVAQIMPTVKGPSLDTR